MSSYAFRSRFAGFDREIRELVQYSNYLVDAYEDTFYPSSYAVPGKPQAPVSFHFSIKNLLTFPR